MRETIRTLAAACGGLRWPALALAACRDSGGEGEFFEIAGKLFVFNYRVATATYLVNLDAAAAGGGRPDRGGAASRTRPAATPIVVRQKIWPKLAKTTIESPPLRCVVKDRPYAVSISDRGRRRHGAADDRDDDDLVARTRRCCRTGRWSSGRSIRPIPNLSAIPTASCLTGRAALSLRLSGRPAAKRTCAGPLQSAILLRARPVAPRVALSR